MTVEETLSSLLSPAARMWLVNLCGVVDMFSCPSYFLVVGSMSRGLIKFHFFFFLGGGACGENATWVRYFLQEAENACRPCGVSSPSTLHRCTQLFVGFGPLYVTFPPLPTPGRFKVLFCASGVLKFGSGCLDWAFSLALDDPFLWRCSF